MNPLIHNFEKFSNPEFIILIQSFVAAEISVGKKKHAYKCSINKNIHFSIV